jgi:hypothetical protein
MTRGSFVWPKTDSKSSLIRSSALFERDRGTIVQNPRKEKYLNLSPSKVAFSDSSTAWFKAHGFSSSLLEVASKELYLSSCFQKVAAPVLVLMEIVFFYHVGPSKITII